MLIEKTNDAQAVTLTHYDQALQHQYQVIQTEHLELKKHYQTLYNQHQALLERWPTSQGQYSGIEAYLLTLQDYHQSQQEHRHSIQEFRLKLHKFLIITRSYRSNQNCRIQAVRPLIRKTILLGVGKEKEAAYLKDIVQRTSDHRVFLAADSSQVLSLVQNVYIDLLVLDDELTTLPGIELYHHLHRMKGLETPPAIIMSDCFSPLYQAELSLYNLIGLEKPIKVFALMNIMDKLLV